MSAFAPAIAVVLRHEGGYVDDPVDRGGETNFGISTKFIRDNKITAAMLELENLEPGALRGLTLDKATDIYAQFFWYRYHYGRVDDQICATKIMDACVNCGPRRGHLLAQQAAIVCGQFLVADGLFGQKTVEAINACGRVRYLQALGEEMADFYRAIIKTRPEQVRFLRQWLVRAAWPGLKLRNVRPEDKK